MEDRYPLDDLKKLLKSVGEDLNAMFSEKGLYIPDSNQSKLLTYDQLKQAAFNQLFSSFNQLGKDRDIKIIALKSINDDRPIMETLKTVNDFVDKMNVSESIRNNVKEYYRIKIYDTHAQFNRLTGFIQSQQIGLTNAVFNGGLVRDSREFCKIRNGNVYHLDEILSWKSLEFVGKPLNYDPIIDCGGEGCRHKLDWISDEMAIRLRK